MKSLILAASIGLVVAGVASEAVAACAVSGSVTAVTGAALRTLLSGKTVCVKASGGGWEWQEEHIAGGTLRDYKKGPNDKIDPSEVVGTWNVDRSGNVVHSYTGAPPFSYAVFNNGDGTHSFCGGGKDIVATIQNGTGAACR